MLRPSKRRYVRAARLAAPPISNMRHAPFSSAPISQTAPDHMQILQLRYRIGDEIPETDWAKYNLYD